MTPKLAPLPQATPSAPAIPAKSSTAPGAVSQPDASAAANPNAPESYPTVAKMENITFGGATPAVTIENRLARLENAIFKKTYVEDSLFDRTERLKQVLMGSTDVVPPDMPLGGNPDLLMPQGPMDAQQSGQNDASLLAQYLDDEANKADATTELASDAQATYAVELVNNLREKVGMGALLANSVAMKVSTDHDRDLCNRGIVSHSNGKGDNPDRRYTIAGGDGALIETLVTLNRAETNGGKISKATIAKMLKTLISRQDDREAVFAPEATDMGIAIDWTLDKSRLVGCIEMVTRHGTVDPIPGEVHVGEKVDVRGTITEPMKFEKVTVAWEGNHALGSASDESQEALPYFPPLDYAAYQEKSQHDYSGMITALKIAGIAAALAGGVFMPPVALAAPMIAMSGSFGNSGMPTTGF